MRKKILRFISLAIILLILGMIFAFSSEDAEKSGKTSSKVVTVAVWILTGEKAEDLSPERLGSVTHFIRKLAHFTEFFLLSFFSSVFCFTFSLSKKPYVVFPLSFTLLVAFADECHQLFVPGRSGNITDVCIDFSGALLAAFFFLLLRSLLITLKSKKETL